MPTPAPPPRRGRALCLSGGGYRAALFHLGALWRLQVRGRLADLALLSAVSGGSIVAAWLMRRYVDGRRGTDESFADWCRRVDFGADVVEPFRTIVARDIRSVAVLATVGINAVWPDLRMRLLQRAYRDFFGELTLGELPTTPRVVFCASDLTFGVNWEFSRERVGDYLAGYLREPGALPLTLAVAASSSFPPVFGPLRLHADADDFVRGRYREADASALRRRIELTDGGVYDNLGTEPALRRYAEVLVSDAGAPFGFRAGRHYLRRLWRYTEVIGHQAGALRKRLYFAQRHAGSFDGAYWSLAGRGGLFASRGDAGADGYAPTLVTDVLARLRTDLDRFDDAEFEVLVNHGWFRSEAALGADPAQPAGWPYPRWSDEAAVRRALRHSHRRLHPPRWWRR